MLRKLVWIQPTILDIPRAGTASVMLADGPVTFEVMDQSDHRRVETLREYNDQAGQAALRAVRSAFGEKD